MRGFVIVVLLAGMVAACSSYRGSAEFGAYRNAFSTMAETSEAVLDRLAVAERRVFAVAHPFDPEIDGFDPDTAAYVSTAGDPPATQSFRRTIRAARAYSDALHGLATGETADALTGRLTTLGALGEAAVGAPVRTDTGASGNLPGIAGTVASINTMLGALEPLTRSTLGFGTRRAFRERLTAHQSTIRAALLETRSGTRVVFAALQDAILLGHDDAEEPELGEEKRREIRAVRELMADWVVLIDATITAFDVAVAASAGEGRPGGFDGLLMVSEDLASAARAARMNLAGAAVRD